MNSFLNPTKPILTGLLKTHSKSDLLNEIKSMVDNVDAFGLQVDLMERENRNSKDIKDLYDAMNGKKIYVTSYRRGNICPDYTDDELAEQLLMAVECGADLADIPGDMYCESKYEVTTNKEAIEKQKNLINQIHAMGKEVLMSSHVLEYIPKEAVLTIAKMQQERGVDIAKIVTAANTQAELDENFQATMLLKKELKINSLFLCNGEYSKKHRYLAPLLLPSIVFVKSKATDEGAQPVASDARAFYNYLY